MANERITCYFDAFVTGIHLKVGLKNISNQCLQVNKCTFQPSRLYYSFAISAKLDPINNMPINCIVLIVVFNAILIYIAMASTPMYAFL